MKSSRLRAWAHLFVVGLSEGLSYGKLGSTFFLLQLTKTIADNKSQQDKSNAMHRYFLCTGKTAANAGEYVSMSRRNPAILVQEITEEKNLYEQLLEKGYSKQSIHKVLHYLMLQEIQHKKATVTHTTIPEKPSPCAKDSHFLKNLISKMVSLIKTQFAKKPKNPV